MHGSNEIRVWDPFVRAFHWSLALLFVFGFATGDEWMGPHTWAGYLILGLVGLRLVWGLIGTRHARFADFLRTPGQVRAYLGALVRGRAPRYVGHNPAGGLMIVLLLISLAITGVSGIATYGAEEGAGPLAGWMAQLGPFWGEAAEEIHEFFANLTLGLVLVHVAGVLVESLLQGENLVRAMITGRKRV